jgi:ParE toxin of type II toxin-antitoxin system, parDE
MRRDGRCAPFARGVLALARHPEVGRPVDEMPPEFREFIPFGQSGYVGPYRYDGKAVVVLAVRHGRGEPLGTRANVLAACGRSGPLKQRMFSDSEPFVWCVWQGGTSFLVDPAEPVD